VRTLVIPDLHAPCVRKYALEFCQDIYYQWDCNDVKFIGDVVDWSAISFHAHNPEAPGPSDEFKLAKAEIHKWYKAFPKASIMIGNHDARVIRLAESVDIPAKFIRSFKSTWETPKWKWVHHEIQDGVYYCHGHKKGGGKTPAWNIANKIGMSVVSGHFHSRAGVNWSTNPLRRWFGMNVGALIDDEAYAFAYASEQTERSVLGVGVVIDGIPHFEPMPVGRGETYHDSGRFLS